MGTDWNVRQASERILTAFRTNNLPAALAPVFRRGTPGTRPSDHWSWNNRLLMALAGTSDARGFRQWQEVNRYVKAGSKAFHILAPLFHKRTVQGEDGPKEETYITGFRAVPVFTYEDTDGEALPDEEPVADLPLLQVAQAWGIRVRAADGSPHREFGSFCWGGTEEVITLHVENLSTWAHELCHASEHQLTKSKVLSDNDKRADREVIAELGGAIILEVLGFHTEADLGGCHEYLAHWGGDPLRAAMSLLDRTCKVVAHVFTTARELEVAA